jgi:hypothetical protein
MRKSSSRSKRKSISVVVRCFRMQDYRGCSQSGKMLFLTTIPTPHPVHLGKQLRGHLSPGNACRYSATCFIS